MSLNDKFLIRPPVLNSATHPFLIRPPPKMSVNIGLPSLSLSLLLQKISPNQYLYPPLSNNPWFFLLMRVQWPQVTDTAGGELEMWHTFPWGSWRRKKNPITLTTPCYDNTNYLPCFKGFIICKKMQVDIIFQHYYQVAEIRSIKKSPILISAIPRDSPSVRSNKTRLLCGLFVNLTGRK